MPDLNPPIHDPDIRTVQEQLGHRDVMTTMIYTHVLSRGGQRVPSRIACRRLSPRGVGGRITSLVVTMKIPIELPEAQADKLRGEAQRLGVRPEDLATAAVLDLLNREASDFDSAVRYVLQKNRALYQRLS